jgi:hypothetical protein
MSLESGAPDAAPTAEAAPSSDPIRPADLAGLFRAELDAESAPASPVEPAAAATTEIAPDAPVEAAPATESTPVEVDTATAEQQDGPETDPAPAAIVAPSGMSEADKAVFAALPPEAKAWIAKRENETRADYTRKTQAVAAQRQEVESAQAQVLEKLQQYDGILSQFTTRQLAPPDPALRMTDPVAYEDQVAKYLHDKHLQENAATEQAKVRREHEALSKQQQQTFWTEQAQALKDLAPELAASTPEAKAHRQAAADYGLKHGYTKAQLDNCTARDLVTLSKAQRYDAAMAAKTTARTVVPPAPKVMQPGPAKAGGRSNGFASRVEALSQNPSRASLAAAYAAELASER